MSGRGWETFTKVWEGSRGPSAGSGGVGRFFRRSGKGREILSEVREGSEALLEVWEGSGGPLGGLGGTGGPPKGLKGSLVSLVGVLRPSKNCGRSFDASQT